MGDMAVVRGWQQFLENVSRRAPTRDNASLGSGDEVTMLQTVGVMHTRLLM